MGTSPLGEVPVNLPIATDALAYLETSVAPVAVTDSDEDELVELENHAHAAQVLLSSDAMRYLATGVTKVERLAVLDRVMAAAKAAFPSDDGWTVVNLSRMEHLVGEVGSLPAAAVLAEAPVAPMVAGSLAEAIVTGNVLAAYELIEHRPMVALADAATDLDAVYRSRKGEKVHVSNLLTALTQNLETQKIEATIVALTSALDGTYTDETSAVKMAIMKAIKVIG